MPISSETDREAISRLVLFIKANAVVLGGASDRSLDILLDSVAVIGARTIVRFRQVESRHLGLRFKYVIGVEGSSVVANIINGYLTSLNSSFSEPPMLDTLWKHPGVDISSFTEPQFEVFLDEIKKAPHPDRIYDYFATAARKNGRTFDPATFKKEGPSQQKSDIADLLAHLGSQGTERWILDLAERGDLKLIRRGQLWNFQVSKIFGLPMEFDMSIPRADGEHWVAKNLRLMQQAVAVKIYDGKYFPNFGSHLLQTLVNEDASPIDVDGAGTAKVLEKILRYFETHHNWANYQGRDSDGKIEAAINITDARIIANGALWMPHLKQILIGNGSSIMENAKTSAGVLGHEFTHAIVGSTSGLIFEGESGALNEHFADIEGVYIESEAKGQPFRFAIGDDVLNPSAAADQAAVNAQFVIDQKFTAEQIKKFSLDSVPLRHLLYPQLSYLPSYPDLASAKQSLGGDCEPSLENDRCGVHSWSGIPNRAVSMIIAALGEDRVRDMIFNTTTARLTTQSTFQEYVRQMYEECLITPGLDKDKDCAVVINSFAQVGVMYPQGKPPNVAGEERPQ